MSGSSSTPQTGPNPYTDPPPIEQRRFYEDPIPPENASFAQVMQGRGAPAPRAGYEHEQQEAARPEDSKPDVSVSPGTTVAELLAMPADQQTAALAAIKAQAEALAAQQQMLAEELAPPPPAEPAP